MIYAHDYLRLILSILFNLFVKMTADNVFNKSAFVLVIQYFTKTLSHFVENII